MFSLISSLYTLMFFFPPFYWSFNFFFSVPGGTLLLGNDWNFSYMQVTYLVISTADTLLNLCSCSPSFFSLCLDVSSSCGQNIVVSHNGISFCGGNMCARWYNHGILHALVSDVQNWLLSPSHCCPNPKALLDTSEAQSRSGAPLLVKLWLL